MMHHYTVCHDRFSFKSPFVQFQTVGTFTREMEVSISKHVSLN